MRGHIDYQYQMALLLRTCHMKGFLYTYQKNAERFSSTTQAPVAPLLLLPFSCPLFPAMLYKSFITLALASASSISSLVAALPVDMDHDSAGLQGLLSSLILMYSH